MTSSLSFPAWFTRPRFAAIARPPAAADLEPIRRAMLAALGARVAQPYTILAPRIAHAVDAERLWYLRGELMQALASMHGEQRARSELERITELFRDVLPQGLAAGLPARPQR
jgi:hypothetical protein